MTARRKAVIVGAGGHGRVVASLLAHLADVELVGVADRTDRYFGEEIGSTRIVMTFEELASWPARGVRWAGLALGDNGERALMFARLKAIGFTMLSATHPTAIVERDVALGEGVFICAGAIVCTQVRAADDVLINTGAIIDHEGVIGAHAHIATGCRVAGRVRIGDGAFVGAGSTIRDGLIIGSRTVIGAGSVVVEDIPDDVVAFGVPARVQRHV